MPTHIPSAQFRRQWFPAVTVGVVVAVSVTAATWFFLRPPPQVRNAGSHIPVKPAGVVQQHPEAPADPHAFDKARIPQQLDLKLRQELTKKLNELQHAEEILERLKKVAANPQDPAIEQAQEQRERLAKELQFIQKEIA